jgi:hypothetical protein
MEVLPMPCPPVEPTRTYFHVVPSSRLIATAVSEQNITILID